MVKIDEKGYFDMVTLVVSDNGEKMSISPTHL